MKAVPIKLDKQRSLRYSNNAVMMFEDATGKSILKGASANTNRAARRAARNRNTPEIVIENDFTFREIITLVWAGLCHEDEALTVEEVADLIDEYSDIHTVMTAAGKALTLAFEGKAGSAGSAEQSRKKNQ